MRQISNLRIMQSTSLTGLVPFNVQEIFQTSGIYYGVNGQSKNIIKADRKRLKNGNGFVFATYGAGKSMFVKDEIGKLYLTTNDDFIIIDPEAEYYKAFHNLNCQEVKISTSTNNYINPFEVYGKVTNEDLANKVDFVISIIDQSINGEVTPRQKSIISRVIMNIYKPLMKGKTDVMPTMKSFYEELKKQKEEEALDLALSMEIFVEGTLNIFSHQTNVDMKNRMMIYNIHDLGKQLWSIGMFVMLENITSRIEENRKKGKNTWIYKFICYFQKRILPCIFLGYGSVFVNTKALQRE